MIKKLFIKMGIAAAAVCAVCATGISALATTIDDVAATARRYGIPDSFIQQGLNEYYEDPSLYTSADFDGYIEYIEAYHQEILNKLMPNSDNSDNKQPTVTQPVSPTDDTTPTDVSQTSPSDTTTQPPASTDNGGNTPSGNSGSKGSSNSGSTANRIPESDFIDMTLDEKQDYISSLPEDQQQDFLNSLSADELKSIVKQLPMDDKADVIDSFVKAGDSLGVKVTVNEITEDTVSMIMRNKDGELIDIATVGVIVEDTGYDYRVLYSVSGAFILIAVSGIWLLIRKFSDKKETEVENEQ